MPFTLLGENCSPGFKTAGFTSGTLSGKPLKNDGRKLEDNFLLWEGNFFFLWGHLEFVWDVKDKGASNPHLSAPFLHFSLKDEGIRYPPKRNSGRRFTSLNFRL